MRRRHACIDQEACPRAILFVATTVDGSPTNYRQAETLGVGSPGDYAAFKFPPTPRHDRSRRRAGEPIIAVAVAVDESNGSVAVNLYDLTDLPRQRFGGYTLLEVTPRKDGRLKAEGIRSLVQRLPSVREVVVEE